MSAAPDRPLVPPDPSIEDFYQCYPMMEPFVGERFMDRRRPSVLLVGESHYLPKKSALHLQPEPWYGGTGDALSPDERQWVHTRDILTDACRNRFPRKGHSIWRESLRTLNAHGPRHKDFVSAAQDIAFYNFFLRPAREGKSLDVTSQDERMANRAFEHWRQRLAPTVVVFLSALAYRSLHNRAPGTPIQAVPHPASHWWNRRSSKYGGKTGRERFGEHIAALPWPTVESAAGP